MKNVVIIGAGTAGLAAAQGLRGKANLVVLERKGGFGELANSSPCTFRNTLETLLQRFNMHEPLREAIRKNSFDFGNREKYPHFDRTDEGPGRLERILAANSAAVPAVHNQWLFDAVVQNPLKHFAFIAQDRERRFKTSLVKIDPVVLHRVLAAGIEGSIQFGTTVLMVDERKREVHAHRKGSQTGKETIQYDVLIDASGSAMVTSPYFIPLEWHNCYEHLIRVGKPFPQWFVERAAFRIDLDPNANPKDPTNTSCVWIYPIDSRHVIIGPDDYVGPLVLQNPEVSKERIMEILRERLIADINNDPSMKGLFDDYEILDSRFNTIPQSGIGMRQCANGVMRIGDAGLDATPLSAEGIRRGIEMGAVAAHAVLETRDDASLAEKYLSIRGSVMARDWMFEMARLIVFNLYNDRVWDAQAAKFGGISDKVMEEFLRNNAGLFKLVPALPFAAIAREVGKRIRRGEIFKEVYDGNAMRRQD